MISAVVLCAVVLAGLLLYRLGSLTGGLDSSEVQLTATSSSWHNLIHNPLNLPLTAIQWLVFAVVPHHGQTITRLPSVILGLLSLWSFAYILRRWYGIKTAVLGTILFAFSSWFLHASRLAAPNILFVWGVLTLLVIHIWVDRATKPLTIMAALTGTALLLYIPGMVWLVLINYFWQGGVVRDQLRLMKQWWQWLLTIIIFAGLIALLGWTFWQDTSLIRTWLGAPTHFGSPLTILKQFVKVPWYVFYHAPNKPQLWLTRVPLLDIFSAVMFGLGAYFYARHWQAPRTRLLASFILIGAALYALGGPVTLSIILPIIYIVLIAGVAYILHEWFQVFPLNPLARGVGIILLSAVVILVCFYHVRSYFVAWPHNPETVSVFDHRI